MIDLIKQFFEKDTRDTPIQNEEQKSHRIHIATCALLLEMAHIDGEFGDSERESIITALKSNYRLSEEEARSLMEATEKELKESIDLWQFTNLINQNYSLDDKIRIIETVWKVAYADGRLDSHEDYLVHKLAELLRLSHKQLIDTKLKVLHADKE
jgi:uncharacterized tellurite resistance protein B-like protein